MKSPSLAALLLACAALASPACQTSGPIDRFHPAPIADLHVVEPGTASARLPRSWQKRAPEGLIGCLIAEHDRAPGILERLVDVEATDGLDWAKFAVRSSATLSFTTRSGGRWHSRGPVVHLAGASLSNASSHIAKGTGSLARVFWEDDTSAMCIVLGEPSPLEITFAWRCRPELSDMLAAAIFPVGPYLAGDPIEPMGSVERVEGPYFRITKRPPVADDMVHVSWLVEGDHRVPWRGTSQVPLSTFGRLVGTRIEPMDPRTASDPIAAITAPIGRIVSLTKDSHATVVIATDGHSLMDRRIVATSSFHVACILRNLLVMAHEAEPGARTLSCNMTVMDPHH